MKTVRQCSEGKFLLRHMGPQEEMVSDITNNNVSGLEQPCSMDLAQAFLWAIRKKALGLLENNTVPI